MKHREKSRRIPDAGSSGLIPDVFTGLSIRERLVALRIAPSRRHAPGERRHALRPPCRGVRQREEQESRAGSPPPAGSRTRPVQARAHTSTLVAHDAALWTVVCHSVSGRRRRGARPVLAAGDAVGSTIRLVRASCAGPGGHAQEVSPAECLARATACGEAGAQRRRFSAHGFQGRETVDGRINLARLGSAGRVGVRCNPRAVVDEQGRARAAGRKDHDDRGEGGARHSSWPAMAGSFGVRLRLVGPSLALAADAPEAGGCVVVSHEHAFDAHSVGPRRVFCPLLPQRFRQLASRFSPKSVRNPVFFQTCAPTFAGSTCKRRWSSGPYPVDSGIPRRGGGLPSVGHAVAPGGARFSSSTPHRGWRRGRGAPPNRRPPRHEEGMPDLAGRGSAPISHRRPPPLPSEAVTRGAHDS
jgi:hypothetical protein